MTNQTKNNNLNYLINATFIKVLSFENETDRTYFSKYYLPNVQINDFNVLIDGKGFFDMPIKNGKKKMGTSYWNGKNNITRQEIYWTMSTFQNITN